jgi:hypothetical protein
MHERGERHSRASASAGLPTHDDGASPPPEHTTHTTAGGGPTAHSKGKSKAKAPKRGLSASKRPHLTRMHSSVPPQRSTLCMSAPLSGRGMKALNAFLERLSAKQLYML